jgi:membrane protein
LAELHTLLGLDLTDAPYDNGKATKSIEEAETARIEAMKIPLSEVVG